jgi:hypothetical protein
VGGVTAARDGMHITVTDLSTGHSGTIVLDSQTDGPLMPAFDVQKLGNALGWGLVNDAPNSLVWDIGHTTPYHSPASRFCLPASGTVAARRAGRYGGNYPGTTKDFGQVDQFQPELNCVSPAGPYPPYCSTVLH